MSGGLARSAAGLVNADLVPASPGDAVADALMRSRLGVMPLVDLKNAVEMVGPE